MADDPERRDARSLVHAILASTPPAPPTPEAPATPSEPAQAARSGADEPPSPEAPPAAASPDPGEAAALIEVYFDLEQPAERDVLFDQIVELQAPVVTDFLRVMMQEDEDELLRAAAAAELARRGVAEGIAALEADLDDPEELHFFETAVQVLAEVRGPAFYDTVAAIWRDPERDADLRREAMLGMESCDLPRALADLSAAIDAIADAAALPDDQLEVAIMVFVRHEHGPAVEPLSRLRDRLAAAELDPEERRELVELVQEGIDLLRDPRCSG